jgi:hypothetical protein
VTAEHAEQAAVGEVSGAVVSLEGGAETLKDPEPCWRCGASHGLDSCPVLQKQIEDAKKDLGLPAMQTQMDTTDARLQKLIDILKNQGGILHEEI